MANKFNFYQNTFALSFSDKGKKGERPSDIMVEGDVVEITNVIIEHMNRHPEIAQLITNAAYNYLARENGMPLLVDQRILADIEEWSKIYEFSFQFWGYQNNVFINKGDVEMASFGGLDTIQEVMVSALQWVYKVNRTPQKERVC